MGMMPVLAGPVSKKGYSPLVLSLVGLMRRLCNMPSQAEYKRWARLTKYYILVNLRELETLYAIKETNGLPEAGILLLNRQIREREANVEGLKDDYKNFSARAGEEAA
jgi:hypothetical protein